MPLIQRNYFSHPFQVPSHIITLFTVLPNTDLFSLNAFGVQLMDAKGRDIYMMLHLSWKLWNMQSPEVQKEIFFVSEKLVSNWRKQKDDLQMIPRTKKLSKLAYQTRWMEQKMMHTVTRWHWSGVSGGRRPFSRLGHWCKHYSERVGGIIWKQWWG